VFTERTHYNYQYDAADRMTQQTYASQVGTTTFSGTMTYHYDATDQLLNDGTSSYSYDKNGNRTMSGYVTSTGNQLTNDGTWTYTYDSEGNTTSKTKGTGSSQVTWTYSYDNANELTGAVETGSTGTLAQLTYSYDAEGDRVQQQVWTSTSGTMTTTRFAIDPVDGGNTWMDMNGSNSPIARYEFGPGTDQIVTRTEASGTYAGVGVYFTDALGSVRDIANWSGVLEDHIEYTSFGVPTESNAAAGDRFKFDGYEYEVTTGLYSTETRVYNPSTGTWLTQDPISFAGGDTNLQRYAGNDPTNATDPSGLKYYMPWDKNASWGWKGSVFDDASTWAGRFNNKTMGIPDTYGAIKEGNWRRLIPYSSPYYNMKENYEKYLRAGVGETQAGWLTLGKELPLGGNSVIAALELGSGRSLQPEDFDHGIGGGEYWARVATIVGEILSVIPAGKLVTPALRFPLGGAGGRLGSVLAIEGAGSIAVPAMSVPAAEIGAGIRIYGDINAYMMAGPADDDANANGELAKEDAQQHMAEEDALLDPHDAEFYGGDGVVYEVPGTGTPSGKRYIGTADDLAQRAKTATDGRDRSQATVIGRYPIGNKEARRQAEQAAIDARGGIDNLDNRRNEIGRNK
jgi:RHS repeat-associated protein